MAKFRIATPAGASFTVAGGGYGYELEALVPIDAEIYEVPAGSEAEFVAAAKDADALYAKGRAITKAMIEGLQRCKIIAAHATRAGQARDDRVAEVFDRFQEYGAAVPVQRQVVDAAAEQRNAWVYLRRSMPWSGSFIEPCSAARPCASASQRLWLSSVR